MKFRELKTSSGVEVILGKDAKTNDELMEKFKGKENTILHTAAPGSPFCVIAKLKPSKEEIKEAGMICASKSQDWRDNKQDVTMHVFTGKDIKKPRLFPKEGTWKVKKAKTIIIKKEDIRRKNDSSSKK